MWPDHPAPSGRAHSPRSRPSEASARQTLQGGWRVPHASLSASVAPPPRRCKTLMKTATRAQTANASSSRCLQSAASTSPVRRGGCNRRGLRMALRRPGSGPHRHAGRWPAHWESRRYRQTRPGVTPWPGMQHLRLAGDEQDDECCPCHQEEDSQRYQGLGLPAATQQGPVHQCPARAPAASRKPLCPKESHGFSSTRSGRPSWQ